MDEIERQRQATKLLSFTYNLAKSSYESELRRQSQIMEQSRTIQTVFSIISVAILTIIPWLNDILIQKKQLIPLVTLFYFIVFALLIIALVLASIAQYRRKLNSLPDIDVIEKTVNDNFKNFLNDDTQVKFKIDELTIIQKDITNNNDLNSKLINLANIVLIITILLIFLFSFIIAIFILLS